MGGHHRYRCATRTGLITNLLAASTPAVTDGVVAVTRTVFEQASPVSRFAPLKFQRNTALDLDGYLATLLHVSPFFLMEAGGFDPERYHAEDMEVSLRLLEKQGVIVYAPNAIVRHVPNGFAAFSQQATKGCPSACSNSATRPKRKREGPGLISGIRSWFSDFPAMVDHPSHGLPLPGVARAISRVMI